MRTVHHVDEFISPSLIACQDRSILMPDLVLCVSRPWIDRLADEFGVDAQLVRNGVDGARFRAPRDAAERAADRAALGLGDRLAVLTVGGIEPRKGSLTLLEGFAHLRAQAPDRDPLLLVVGGATLFDYRDEIGRFEARARELGVAEHVRIVGTVSPADLERHYRAADVFAFPSTKEGFGLVALEALAAGLPVVASQIDVFLTFLAHGESALLSPTGDGSALGRSLTRLARDPQLRERLVSRGPPRRRRLRLGRRGGRARGRLPLLPGPADRSALMADALHVQALRSGPLSATVTAREHEVVVDEPASVGGGDGGMMPTELMFAALSSCFCLAVAHVAAKRDIELPGLRVTVDAERIGRELRYGRIRVEVAAAAGDADLAALVERAKPFCWVSNMLANDLEVDYVPVVLRSPATSPSDAH